MKQRYEWLDFWRTLAVLTMVVFHAMWDLELFGIIPNGTMETPTADVIRYCGGGSFILISGMLALRSERGLRRGFLIFCIGIVVSIVTTMAGMPIRFGILQLLGVCMMFCSALQERLRLRSGVVKATVFFLLFAAAWLLTANITVTWRYLYPIGLRPEGFYSADYWPLLPWGFLYLCGTQIGTLLLHNHAAAHRHIPALFTYPGRHSLVIYLVHQPILYGLCRIIFGARK